MIDVVGRILFAAVVYNQRVEDTNVYQSLLHRIAPEDMYIWDNSNSDVINRRWNASPAKYVYSRKNTGVSYPYNRASEYAVEKGFEWMVLLDQDTMFDDSYIDTLRSAIREHPETKIICPRHRLTSGLWLSPVKSHLKSTRPSKQQVAGVIDLKKYAIINSGLAIEVDTFRKVGGYNEAVFLDYSDFQFMDRLSQVERKAYCMDSVCIQDFSNDCVDAEKLLNRFSLFCRSLRGICANSLKDDLSYKLVVVKRCASLMVRLRSIRPLRILIKDYLRL